jgi:hypothetical protein
MIKFKAEVNVRKRILISAFFIYIEGLNETHEWGIK